MMPGGLGLAQCQIVLRPSLRCLCLMIPQDLRHPFAEESRERGLPSCKGLSHNHTRAPAHEISCQSVRQDSSSRAVLEPFRRSAHVVLDGAPRAAQVIAFKETIGDQECSAYVTPKCSEAFVLSDLHYVSEADIWNPGQAQPEEISQIPDMGYPGSVDGSGLNYYLLDLIEDDVQYRSVAQVRQEDRAGGYRRIRNASKLV